MNRAGRIAKRTIVCMMSFIVAGAALLSGAAPAFARVVYTYEDRVSAVRLPEEKPFVSGRHMVWLEPDGSGYRQVFYQALDGAEKRQITNLSTLKGSPQVGEAADGSVYIVWGDLQSLYVHELQSGREWKVYDDANRTYGSFAMSGADVVTSDPFTGDLMHYDLQRGTEANLGKGTLPAVADGKVLYVNSSGGLTLCRLDNGESGDVLTLPYHMQAARLAFNGKYALYRQDDLDGRSKYVLLDTTDANAEPVDLTPMTRKTTEYYQMYIGDNYAAWVQESNGVPELRGANLAKAETYTMAQGDEAMRSLAFQDDRLLRSTADGYLAYRFIVRTEATDTGDGDGGRSYALPPVLNTESAKGAIGPGGGELAAPDGSVRLRVPAGALERETEMELKPNAERTEALNTMDRNETQRPASRAWDVALGDGLKGSATLVFGYAPDLWTGLQTRKMHIYRRDDTERVWKRTESKLDAGGRAVSAEIAASGTYALFVNDVTFTDTRDHWAQAYIEILASRDIVNGVDEGRFAPDETLTRAQFTKMLLGSLGIAPEAHASSPFRDVPSDHWSAGWVAAAASRGLAQGDGERFDPDAELTREQMTVLLVRAMGLEDQALAMEAADIGEGLAYTDAAEISGWAKAYAALASASGLIEGDGGMIRPQQSSTRAQAAAVIYRLLNRPQSIR